MKRERAYGAISETLKEVGFDTLGWTPEVVAETERRMAIDDADVWDSSAHYVDFALRVLDKLGVTEAYDGPGDRRPSHGTQDGIPDPPGHLKDLVDRLLRHRFVEVQSDYDTERFGNVARVFERTPVRVRIVRDRGDWSAELTADRWSRRDHPDEEWVFLPPLIAKAA